MPLALALTVLSGCEPPRPSGAYVGMPLGAGQSDAGAGDAAVSEDSSIPPGGGNTTGGSSGMSTGTQTGGTGNVAPDAGGGQSTGGDPRDAVVGDYLLRFDNTTKVDHDSLGEVTSKTVTYGVMRLQAEGDQGLSATEWLCHSDSTQTAERGTMRTVIPGADVWRNLTAVSRAVTIDAASGTWSTEPGTRRQGWAGPGGPDEMPLTIEGNRDRLLNPNGDDVLGLTTRITANPTVLPGITCTFGIVSTSVTSYVEGRLSAAGLPESARVELLDSKVRALSASTGCSTSDINDGPPPPDPEIDELRLSRVAGQWLSGDGKVCPAKAEFEAALP